MRGEPWRGWRHVRVTTRRTRQDDARCGRELVETYSPQARQMRLVQENLHTHDGASLSEAFSPQEARRFLDKMALHSPPKQGSGLNMAETEIGLMTRHCLQGRLDHQSTRAAQVAAWQRPRNAKRVCMHWTFTLAVARQKLRNLYPSIED